MKARLLSLIPAVITFLCSSPALAEWNNETGFTFGFLNGGLSSRETFFFDLGLQQSFLHYTPRAEQASASFRHGPVFRAGPLVLARNYGSGQDQQQVSQIMPYLAGGYMFRTGSDSNCRTCQTCCGTPYKSCSSAGLALQGSLSALATPGGLGGQVSLGGAMVDLLTETEYGSHHTIGVALTGSYVQTTLQGLEDEGRINGFFLGANLTWSAPLF